MSSPIPSPHSSLYSAPLAPSLNAVLPLPAPPIAPPDESLESLLERAQLSGCLAGFRRASCLEADDLRDADDEGLKLAGLNCFQMRRLRRFLANPTVLSSAPVVAAVVAPPP